MTQYFSGDAVLRRESLKDILIARTAHSTPLLSRLPQVSVNHTVVEWGADRPFTSSESVRSLSAPHNATRHEGSDFSFREPFEPVRMRAIAQIDHEGMEMSNTRRAANIAGQTAPFDYEAGKLGTKLMNRIDNVLHYGQGSPETSGKPTSTNQRQTQGLIQASAWTGLERCHGTKTTVEDCFGISIPSDMFSVFYDVNHSQSLTADIFYDQIWGRAANAGANFSVPWTFQCGYSTMGRVARFMIASGATPINDRQSDAASGVGYDYLATMRLPSGHYVNFMTNRWLDERNSTFTVNNTDYTPGSPTTEGSINRTFAGDQTIIGYEPGRARIGWYREPAYRKVETVGDYSRIAIVAEWMFQLDHPLCAIGAGNVLA